jgi:VWFA-related protein
VPAEFDSANAEPSEPTPARVEPVDSPTANVPPIPTKDLNEQTDTGNQPAISLRVTTRMVLLDVVATDKNGKLIADLHPTDVAILEDGRPQSIKLFSLATNDSAGSQKKTPQLPPNVFSNRPEYRQPAGPLVLLLLDGINTATTDQAYARRQMLQYVRTLKSYQRVAIFALTTDLLLLQDFTSDPQTLRTALEHYSSNDSLLLARGAPATITSQMADVIAATRLLPNLIRFNQENAITAADDRVRLTLSALQAVARAMIGYPGRKNLIWVSSGFPISIQLSGSNFDLSQNYTSDLANAAALLSQAEVSVYPVDARGLIGNLQDAPSANEIVSTVQSSGNDGFGAGDITRTAPLVTDSHAAMEQVAHETGGRAFYNVNNLASAVAAGVEDGSSYYTLGYYPENKNWDGKFRKISIKSDRKDIKLRFRPGYYAFESSDATAPLDTHQGRNRLVELARAIKDPLPATGVAFWAHLIPAHNGDSATYVEFLVDANSISFAETRDRHNCNLDFAAFSVASNGSVADTAVKNVETPLPASQYANVRKRGVPFRMQINALPENGSLRLAVRDNRTGLLGTLTIPLLPKPLQGGANQ